jgi:hypothetical protein
MKKKDRRKTKKKKLSYREYTGTQFLTHSVLGIAIEH